MTTSTYVARVLTHLTATNANIFHCAVLILLFFFHSTAPGVNLNVA